ncbi:MAG: STT3 domain-containing protein [Candidatus Woesearchaeota archaeon]|nr:STT3 domain-containing protein [Candidatus Woesearchaeota archaeon]MDP7198337.1 STT3 domain-containing protein [Candidatus Woesearchaeota archaeon]MDP7467439.1 STT3 domain-containing protein [Candidatus Woesearchaeota archaeon]MDP7647666.1 STT3 domain-containing protein [Candidatus Woesearchaeota archaeon]
MADDDISIDFGKMGDKIKGMFSKSEKEPTEHEEEIAIDTGKIKDSVKNIFSGQGEDLGKVKKFATTHKTLLVLLLVLALQFVPNTHFFPCVSSLHCPWGSTWMSLQASEMPQTEEWAKNSVETFFRNQISDQITNEYPNLPAERKSDLINEGLTKFKRENGQIIEQQTELVRNQFRAHYEYEEEGSTYLYMPDIDPYNYLRLADNYLDHGILGDRVKDGKQWDDHVIAPRGSTTDPHDLHPYVLAWWYKISNVFKKAPLMQTSNNLPVVLLFLTFIPAFFIAKRYGGSLGGFFAVAMLGLHPAVVGRTLWGHADTDMYNIFFPLWLTWLFLAGFHEKDTKKRLALGALTGFVMGMYAIAWGGWWYIFDFMLATFGVYAIIRAGIVLGVFTHLKSLWERMKWPVIVVAAGLLLGMWSGKFVLVGSLIILLFALACAFRIAKGAPLSALWQDTRMRNMVLFALVLIVSSGIFVSLFQGRTSGFLDAPFAPLGITTLKEAAAPNLWPNVYTTVAELNTISLKDVMNQFGRLLLFISFLGVLGTVFLKDEKNHREVGYAIFLVIWFFATMYATTKGVRFVMMMVPPFSIAFGIASGQIIKWGSKLCKQFLNIGKKVTIPLLFILLALSMSATVGKSYGNTRGDVPIMNDAWYNTLTELKENSNENAIITSWWDYGHHFKYIADRPVTFDGAWQNTPMAHWVGKLLLTDNERESIGILRMLDCGGNQAYEHVEQHINFTPKSIAVVSVLVRLDKTQARKALEGLSFNESATNNVLKNTHCTPPEGFLITSGDMIGKGGVWGHFGSWNFERSDIWVNVKNMKRSEAVAYMQDKYNYTEDHAISTYNYAQSITSESDANGWIAPWPGFASAPAECNVVNATKMECGNGVVLEGDRAFVPTQQGVQTVRGLIYLNKQGEWTIRDYEDGLDMGVAILPGENGNYQALLANNPQHKSIFTRLFYGQGHGLKYYKHFKTEREITGGLIHTWRVDWEGTETTLLPEYIPHDQVEEGAKVSLNYIGWTQEDAGNVVFDSSMPNWQSNNVTPTSPFSEGANYLTLIYGKGGLIKGFNDAIEGMRLGEEKQIMVNAEDGYGLDPGAHPLANKTLYFRVQVVALK